MDNRAEELKTLTLLLSNGDESLSADVALSENDSAAYVNAHAEELKTRGISEPVDGLPWIALTDGLEKTGRLIELDWKESREEFIRAIVKLSAEKEKLEQISEALNSIEIENSEKTSDFLERVNEALKPFDYSVIMIDIHSDSYPICLVPLVSKTSVIDLADRIEADRIHGF